MAKRKARSGTGEGEHSQVDTGREVSTETTFYPGLGAFLQESPEKFARLSTDGLSAARETLASDAPPRMPDLIEAMMPQSEPGARARRGHPATAV